MSLIGETSIVRVRQKASRLYLPTLILAAVSFSLSYFAPQIPVDLQQIVYLAAGSVVFLFWFIPLLSYLFSFLELTNERVIYRFGLFGLRRRDIELAEISSIQIQRPNALSGKVISLLLTDETELILSGYARTKLLAAEIERLAKGAL